MPKPTNSLTPPAAFPVSFVLAFLRSRFGTQPTRTDLEAAFGGMFNFKPFGRGPEGFDELITFLESFESFDDAERAFEKTHGFTLAQFVREAFVLPASTQEPFSAKFFAFQARMQAEAKSAFGFEIFFFPFPEGATT